MYTIVSQYYWNTTWYCHVRCPDGTCVEVRSEAETCPTEQEWIALATSVYEARPADPDPMEDLLRCCSDEQLVAEVLRRHLIIQGE